MKKIKLYMGLAVAALFGLASCQADMDVPELEVPVATMQANTTIFELKQKFSGQTVLCPMKDEATQTPYIIKGRVISSDATGNIYKSIVIQDETSAMPISVNQGQTYTFYRLGQEVVLNVTGLYIGYYNGLMQLGTLGEPYKGEEQLTFMPWSLFQGHVEKNGLPTDEVKYVAQDAEYPSDVPYCIVTDFSKLPASGDDLLKMQGQLVEFRNVHFKEGGVETYAPYQESVNRTLVDANNMELTVRTSGYSNFYNELMPEGNGVVRGIISYYGDAYQLLLRGLGDVMITDKGQKEDPYTVAEAIELTDQGASGWVKGYIVGSVKAGVNDVTSNDDVIFGKDAEMDNNILVAADPACKNVAECIAVELPQGSAFRASVNLVDNPGVLGQAILVSGNLASYLGMPGLTGNGGTAKDVEVDGVTISGGENPDPTPSQGDGSEANPFTASQINAMSTVNNVNLYTGVWAQGYIVGYVDTGIKSYADDASCKFTVPATMATNVLLADSPTETDWKKCISVNFPNNSEYRTALNLKDNPSNLGKLLKIKGNVTKYVGISGIKEPSAYVLGEGGDTPTPPTPGTEETIFTSLAKTDTELSAGWTIENVNMADALSYVWAWKVFSGSGYLNGSANIGGTPYDATSYCYCQTAINLAGYSSVTLTFDMAAKFQTSIGTLCKIVVRENGQNDWTEYSIPKLSPAGGWTWDNAGNLDLTAWAGKSVQVGFKYAGNTTLGADTWEIRDLKITGTK